MLAGILLILAGILSAGSATCMLVPYWSVYRVLQELLLHASDLEKIADYIVFIHDGQVGLFSSQKDELTEQYGIIKCGAAQFDALDKSDIIVYTKNGL